MPQPRTRYQRMELANNLAVAIRAHAKDEPFVRECAYAIQVALAAPATTLKALLPKIEKLLALPEGGLKCCVCGEKLDHTYFSLADGRFHHVYCSVPDKARGELRRGGKK